MDAYGDAYGLEPAKRTEITSSSLKAKERKGHLCASVVVESLVFSEMQLAGPVKVSSALPISLCRNEMLANDSKVLCITSGYGDRLAGIFTQHDYMRMVHRGIDLDASPVSDFMTRDVITARPSTRILAGARALLMNDISCLPIVATDGSVQGVFTLTDLLLLLFQDRIPFAQRRAG